MLLPDYLMQIPPMIASGEKALPGAVSEDSVHRPRAVLGYISEREWALVEFITMTYSSWTHLVSKETRPKLKVDIYAFSHPRWFDQLSRLCTVLDLDTDFESQWIEQHSQCFVIFYPAPPNAIWHSYPYINNVHFFSDERVAEVLKQHYGLIMKSDFDTFLTPGFLSFKPDHLFFGIQEYGILPATQERFVLVPR
jgi:hypothetical protein